MTLPLPILPIDLETTELMAQVRVLHPAGHAMIVQYLREIVHAEIDVRKKIATVIATLSDSRKLPDFPARP